MSELSDAETGQRGYLLTGDDAFLEPYLRVSNKIKPHLQTLRQLTLISAAHQHIEEMVPLVDAKLVELSHAIELRHNQGIVAAQAFVNSAYGKRLMDSIRAEMNSFIRVEGDALVQRDAKFQSTMRHMFIVIVTIGLLTLLLASSFIYLVYRENTASAIEK